jgi:chemotaxis protein MotB
MQDGAPVIIKKVKKGHHGHHGGAWKIALADFMTAMFCFFLVMWLIGMAPEERAAIQAYFNDPVAFGKNPDAMINIIKAQQPKPQSGGKGDGKGQAAQAAEYQQMEEKLEASVKSDPELARLMKEGKIQLRITNEGMVVEFVENEENGEVFFTLGSSEVRDSAKTVIGKVARLLGETGRAVKVQGHTDARPFSGGGMDNYDLSGARANSVRRIMLQSGLTLKQVVGVEALAATQPRRQDDPNHFSNRRVTVLLPYELNAAEIKNLPADGFGADREAHFIMPSDQVRQVMKPPVDAMRD